MIHSIPPGLYCVPAALAGITGADPDSVIHPALNRASRSDSLLAEARGVALRDMLLVLEELGWTARRYRHTDRLRAQVKTWAERSRNWPGRVLLLSVRGHVLLVQDGRVHDNHAPLGAPASEHSYARCLVQRVYLIERRT